MTRHVGLLCPTDPSHGPLIPWPGSERFGWYCPRQEHDGRGDVPRTRAFFKTAEAEGRDLRPTGDSSRAQSGRSETVGGSALRTDQQAMPLP